LHREIVNPIRADNFFSNVLARCTDYLKFPFMRILKTTQAYYPYLNKGGPPAKIRGLARALVRRGHEVSVLTADLGEPNGTSDGSNWQRERSAWGWESRHDGVEAVYLSTLTNYRATTVNLRIASFCARRLGAYDVVHVYGLYDLIGSLVAWFSRRRGIPYVLEPLGMFGPKVRSRQKKRLYGRLVGEALFEGAAVVVATSEAERRELIEGGINAEKIVLRRNGLDLDEFQTLPARGAFRAKHGLSEKELLILFLGRWSFIKGLDLLVQAFSRIESEARLIIAGPDDEDGCAARIRGLIAELHLDERVILTGPIYYGERLQAFVDTDIFVLPSRSESFGNAAAESVACGTPVLVTDRCGIAPLVDAGAGLVVACDVEGLTEGMNRLLGDRSLRTRLQEGCADVARNLSWDEPVGVMESLYASVISRSGVGSVVAGVG
jgi:glycosyltransferase involved in cell wall biosynthesis